MFCAKCGTEASDDSKFCPVCGEPLGEQPKETSEGTVEVNSSDAVASTESSETSSEKGAAKKEKAAKTSETKSEFTKKAMTLYDEFFWVFYVLSGLAALMFVQLAGTYIYIADGLFVIFSILSFVMIAANLVCSIIKIVKNAKYWRGNKKAKLTDLICIGISALFTVYVFFSEIALFIAFASVHA